MTRAELIEAIIEANLTPEERKARRKKWAKRAAIGAGSAAALAAGVHYGPKLYRANQQRIIRNRVHDNIAQSIRARKSHGTPASVRNWYDPIHWEHGGEETKAYNRKNIEQEYTQRKVAQWAHDRMMWGGGREEYEKIKDKPGKRPAFAKSLIRHVEKHPKKYKRKGIEGARGEHPVEVRRHRSTRRKWLVLKRPHVARHIK